MKHITLTELAALLFSIEAQKGMPMFASIVHATEPKMLVKSRKNAEKKNPYQKVLKVSKVNILLNCDYETSVLNQLKKEGGEPTDYQKGDNTMPIQFGPNNTFFGGYKNKDGVTRWAIQYRPNDNSVPTVKYLADGKITDKSKLVDYLPAERTAPTNQGTERPIFWNKLYIDSIMRITICGETYKVIR